MVASLTAARQSAADGGCDSRGHQHFGDQQVSTGVHLGKLVPLGLGHEIECAQLQGLQGDFGAFLCQSADHDHGASCTARSAGNASRPETSGISTSSVITSGLSRTA